MKRRVINGSGLSTRNWSCAPMWRAVVGLGAILALPTLGDGCFVFRWDKKTDINEPTQKAILVYDAGREDLLLQVRYEGALEDFGWLIPVPSLPKVTKGSMQPFYELSQLTQRQFGTRDKGLSLGGVAESEGPEQVKVIEIKTVGAYEISILSASDAGSLERWLRSHGYSIPEGKATIIEDYVRKNWYFVAAKIQLDGKAGLVSATSPKDPDSGTKGRRAVQKQLSSGELHPLLISFDSPKCVFPLRISAVNGKPSEVSVYVLSAEPLLESFIFDQATKKLEQRWIESDKARPQREQGHRETTQMGGKMSLAVYGLETLAIPGRRTDASGRDWSNEDLEEIGNEAHPGYSPSLLRDSFSGDPGELLQCLQVKRPQIKACAKELTRLGDRDWYLTKQVWVFQPEAMRDLEFQPAFPCLAKTLRQPFGSVAAEVLVKCGSGGARALITACASTNSVERVNASTTLRQIRDDQLTDLLRKLFRDPEPKVRLRAVEAAAEAWDPKFIEPLLTFLPEKPSEARSEAIACLGAHEPPDRIPFYVQHFKHSDPAVQEGAVGVVAAIYWANRASTDPLVALNPALKLLSSPSPRVRGYALRLLWDLNRHQLATADRIKLETAAVQMLKDDDLGVLEAALILLLEAEKTDAPRGALLPLLGTASIGHINMTLKLLNLNLMRYGAPQSASAWPRREPLRTWDPEVKERLSSIEAAPLTTNRVALVRLMGLKFLQLNGDTAAINLALPLLRDSNSLVRRRAADVLQLITGATIPEADPVKWEQWWNENRSEFERHHPNQQ